VSAVPGHHPRTRYFAMAAIVGGVHLVILVSLAALEIASLEHAELGRYGRGVVHQLGRALSAPMFLFFRPAWTSWLRPYVGDDRWIIGGLVVSNSLA
jgi:hypothetical protein